MAIEDCELLLNFHYNWNQQNNLEYQIVTSPWLFSPICKWETISFKHCENYNYRADLDANKTLGISMKQIDHAVLIYKLENNDLQNKLGRYRVRLINVYIIIVLRFPVHCDIEDLSMLYHADKSI